MHRLCAPFDHAALGGVVLTSRCSVRRRSVVVTDGEACIISNREPAPANSGRIAATYHTALMDDISQDIGALQM